MPFRSKDSLAAWLDEFATLGHTANVPVRVLEQDGADGANTGLVTAELTGGLAVYIQPDAPGSVRWVVTLQVTDVATELDPAAVTGLSAEFATIAALCMFLEQKSLASDEV